MWFFQRNLNERVVRWRGYAKSDPYGKTSGQSAVALDTGTPVRVACVDRQGETNFDPPGTEENTQTVSGSDRRQ